MSIQQFRDAVYQTIGKRAAATLDLVDALTVAGHVASPVALSEEVPFQRRFSSVYDVLDYSDLDQATLAAVLYAQQPAGCETVAGYEGILSIVRGSLAFPAWFIAHLVNANKHRQGPSDVLG